MARLNRGRRRLHPFFRYLRRRQARLMREKETAIAVVAA